MLSIDFKNIFGLAGHGLSKAAWRQTGERLPKCLQAVAARSVGFYAVIDDADVNKLILQYAKRQKGVYESVVVLGIGGSALGTSCLTQSLLATYRHELGATPRLYVLDNIDPILMRECRAVLNIAKTLFIVISKSGSTPETISQYFYFKKMVVGAGLRPAAHFVFVTDPAQGLLRRISIDENITAFAVPPNVGGRFSVLTAVGLLPAALLGIDIIKLLRGARAMRAQFLNAHFSKNLPFQLAAAQYLLAQTGKTIHVLMPYAHKLIRLADWYRQLVAESIGKAKNNQGVTVNVGITPVAGLGVTDQHSQSQLYNEGPYDKLVQFIQVKKLAPLLKIPLTNGPTEVAYLQGVSFNKLIDVEYRGTAAALTKNNRPNLTITIDAVDAEHLGSLFMLFEAATAFLGELYNINAFNQPGVELSKQLTKQMLSAQKI